jgi:hypothetical protein
MSANAGGEGGGTNGKARDYGEVEARLRGLDSRHIKAAVIGEVVETYSIHALEFGNRGEGGDKREILLTGGVHGDEPAGVEAVLRFLEGPGEEFLDCFVFTVIPCVNPSGFELNTRVNSRDQDINRSMSADDVEEAVLLRQFLAGKCFDVFIDLHEDYEATGFYMYEAERQNRLIGARIVEAIKKIGAVDGAENSDEGLDLPISEGLFGINPNWRDKGFSAYAYYENSNHVVLCETPSTAWPLDQRVEAHLTAVSITLDHYRTSAYPDSISAKNYSARFCFR